MALKTLALSATLALLARTTAAWESGSGGRVMWESNCDFKGSDIYSIDAPSERCGDICADDTNCSHWAWVNNERGGTCWMKNGTTHTKLSAAGLGCGYVIGRFNPSGNPPVTSPPTVNGALNAVEVQTMLNSINALRANNGLGALSTDSRLMAAAQTHSNDQANRCTMTHTSANGASFGDRITAQGYRWNWAAENVAAGQGTVQDVMTSWANSASHRANLLNPNAVNVGFARTIKTSCSGYSQYWTQDFGRLA